MSEFEFVNSNENKQNLPIFANSITKKKYQHNEFVIVLLLKGRWTRLRGKWLVISTHE